ncbi:hypothetical protein C4588_07770 [Candidatus Parcubacteria bacterium]|nr:MAG: hypothetical protein C4588_07770 [Candidatus Parcubacteria bacterium]
MCFLSSRCGEPRQEQSNNLSQISRCGIVRRFQQGKTRVNHNRFMGYGKDENGDDVKNFVERF